MFFFLISSLPFFVLLFSSFPLKSLPSWALDVRSLCILFWREIASLSLKGFALTCCQFLYNSSSMACKKHGTGADNAEPSMETSLLDLPELTLECILEKLPPSGLCNMASVCSSLKDRCRSDYLWERHMREKWGKVIGTAARKEWQWYLATRKDSSCSGAEGAKSRLMGSLACLWPLSWLKSTIDGGSQPISPRRDDSIMSWYLSLESGKFWFPAQVYNREHGHVGFMLSCYDAELCYDSQTDTFQARYPPHGRRTVVVEDGVQWERLRAPPVDTSAHDLHVSDCLSDLRPGDHIEIQWRRNKEFPYGWWYGVVGHLDSCDGNEHFCRCSSNESLILEFHQYTPGSRWRQTTINRKEHQEEGNETDGFYGGIRKIYGKDEISAWRRLWPTEIFE